VSYAIKIKKSAQKSLAKLSQLHQSNIIKSIRNLSNQPRPHGCKKLSGRGAWRIRVGDYRVIYEIADYELVILIVYIGRPVKYIKPKANNAANSLTLSKTSDFPAIQITRKKGTEKFELGTRSMGIDLLQFWQWSSSDLTSNVLRGLLAEFIVASALDVAEGVRAEWDAFDILTAEGIKVEVKSAAYIQSWAQVKPSLIRFNVRPTKGWNAQTNVYSTEFKRQADVYVFCVLAHLQQTSVNPLNLNQWEFYVLSAKKLNELVTQKTISLSRLLQLIPNKTSYDEIAFAVKSEVSTAR